MIKKFLMLFSIILCLAIIYQGRLNVAHSNSFGAPFIGGRGYTNSPFDGRACNISGCHSGTLNSGPGTVEITTDVPADGYRAGVTYNVTATVTQNGIKKFGFQMTSEDENHNKAGKFIANSLTRAPSDFYITQGTSYSSSAGTDTKSWTFKWIAPSQPGKGPLTLYAAFNAANSNNSSSGDRIYTTTLTLEESIFSGIAETGLITNVAIYPNPAVDACRISVQLKNKIERLEYTLITLNGSVARKNNIMVNGTSADVQMDLSDLSPGTYLLRLGSGKDQLVQKLFIHR